MAGSVSLNSVQVGCGFGLLQDMLHPLCPHVAVLPQLGGMPGGEHQALGNAHFAMGWADEGLGSTLASWQVLFLS